VRYPCGQTDRQTDRQTDAQTDALITNPAVGTLRGQSINLLDYLRDGKTKAARYVAEFEMTISDA